MTTAAGQNTSVLATGTWARVSVKVHGVYAIDYNLFQQLGFNPITVNPNRIQIFTGTQGVLPQSNLVPRVSDLREIAIQVTGSSDGTLDPGDKILFYAEGPDTFTLNPADGKFDYQNNPYADRNFYYVTIGSGIGKRIQTLPDVAGSFPVVNTYDDLLYYETEKYNELHSGREWYGEVFDTQTEYTVRFPMSGIANGSQIRLVTACMGQSFAASSFEIFLNGTLVGTMNPAPIINGSFEVKGSDVSNEALTGAASVGAPGITNQDVRIRFNKATTGRSVGYLNHILFQSTRTLSLGGDQTLFQSVQSLLQPTTSWVISSAPATATVWDVTDPFDASIQSSQVSGGSVRFSAASGTLRKYVVLSNQNFPAPSKEGNVPNQNLHNLTNAEMLVVTAPDFLSEANRYATYRASHSGLQVAVVTTTQVYNEFSSGKQDVSAIRDLARHVYVQGAGALQYLLLIGRGSYDYNNVLTFNRNFLPIYESRESLNPLATYSSDDYLGFLEDNEGNWGENPVESHTLDIAVGRIPATTLDEARQAVDKIILYETGNWGDWRKKILFVADDGDFSVHQTQADQLAEWVESFHPEIHSRKLYLDSYEQVGSPLGQISPDATQALTHRVSEGVAIVNFTGHGNETQWMQEKIFDPVSLDHWKTKPHFPILVTATCEFGRNDDPGLISTSERALFRKDGGCIALVTTARPVNSSTNFTLNKKFYEMLFVKAGGKFRTLGQVFMDTKNNSISGVNNRNFSLLGDPSLRLPLPDDELRITGITNLTSGSDTLKGLSKVRLSGAVYTSGLLDPSFEGNLIATVFDKRATLTTLGDEGSPFGYMDWNNIVFSGKGKVIQGEFVLDFVMPSAIDPAVANGKIGVYASSDVRNVTGSNVTTEMGDLEPAPGIDTEGPSIELYVGDTTFIPGGIANKNTRIVAKLQDINGINTSGFDMSKVLLANLDDTLQLDLSSYYQASTGTYQSGKLDYPFLENLKPGQHRLSLRASDTFGNTSTATIVFTVSDQNGIQIEQLFNYPNPASESTRFHFTHNRSGEDLEVQAIVYNVQGQLVMSAAYQVPLSSYQVDLPAWDLALPDGTKLGAGLYVLKVAVRSLLDGSKNERFTKVIVVN